MLFYYLPPIFILAECFILEVTMVEELPGNITELLLTFFLKNLKGLSLSFQ